MIDTPAQAPMPEDDAPRATGSGTRAGAWLRGLIGRPLVFGLVLGLLALGLYGVFLASPPHPPVPQVVHSTQTDDAPDAVAAEEIPEDVAEGMAAQQPEDTAAPAVESPAPAVEAVPVVHEFALLVADTGMSRRVMDALVAALPAGVSIAVSAYAPDVQDSITRLGAGGREVWFQLAAQSNVASVRAGVDAGPLAVAVDARAAQNTNLLKRQLAPVSGGIRGVYVPAHADITASNTAWRSLAQDILGRNLMILDGTTMPVAGDLYLSNAPEQPRAYLKAGAVIAADTGADALRRQLTDMRTRLAAKDVQIIALEGISQPVIAGIAQWLDDLRAQGIAVVPVSRFSGLGGE